MDLVWAFRHLPLMILSGYTGIDLVYYCISFMLAILSVSMVITYFYNKGRSVLIAMWIHFLFNFSLTLFITRKKKFLEIPVKFEER